MTGREAEAVPADVAAALDALPGAADPAALSAQVLACVSPLLAARARAAFWRRLATVFGLSLVPLPVVVAVDVVLVLWLYDVASTWLPSGLALYLVGSYAFGAAVLLGLAYASIPLLLARRAAPDAQPPEVFA